MKCFFVEIKTVFVVILVIVVLTDTKDVKFYLVHTCHTSFRRISYQNISVIYIYIYFNGPVFFLLCPQFLCKACKMFSVIRKDRIDAIFCCFCLKFKIFFGKICSIFNRKCGRKTALSLSRKHDMMAIILYIVSDFFLLYMEQICIS